jgi:hypothetical protein
MPEQKANLLLLLYDLVLQKAHDVSHQCRDRLLDLNRRFACPGREELMQVELNGTSGGVPLHQD